MKYNWFDIKSRVNSTNNANKDLHLNFLMQIIEQSFNGSFPEWFNVKKNISKNAFYCNKKITNIIIPNNVEKIETNAFYECSNLINITLPNSIKEIENSAFTRSGLKSIVISNSVEYIRQHAFYQCSDLETVIIDGNMVSIGYGSFYQNKNLRIVEMKNVKSIDYLAFEECRALTDIFIYNSIPPTLNSYAFQDTNSSFKIHIPIGTKEKYLYESGWNSFNSSRYIEDITL